MVLKNASRGFYPVFPLSRLYTLEGAKEYEYGRLLEKIVVGRRPLLFYDDASCISNRLYLKHLSAITHVPENRLTDHLSGSLQHLCAITGRAPRGYSESFFPMNL